MCREFLGQWRAWRQPTSQRLFLFSQFTLESGRVGFSQKNWSICHDFRPRTGLDSAWTVLANSGRFPVPQKFHQDMWHDDLNESPPGRPIPTWPHRPKRPVWVVLICRSCGSDLPQGIQCRRFVSVEIDQLVQLHQGEHFADIGRDFTEGQFHIRILAAVSQ